MDNTFLRKILTAPISRVLPLFLIVPAVSLLMQKMNILTAVAINLMIINMLLCTCFMAFKAWELCRRFRGVELPIPARQVATPLTVQPEVVNRLLQDSGYRCHEAGRYAERGGRTWATALALTCMVCLLSVGSYDNLKQFGGVVLVGTGEPSRLYDPNAYTMYSRGPFAKIKDINLKVKCVERIMPTAKYPYGAAELRLTDRENRSLWQGTLAVLGSTLSYDGYLFAVNSLEYNIGLILLVDGNHLLYSNWLHLAPMAKPVPGFTHQGTLLKDDLNDVEGTALYNDVTERLVMHLRYQKEYFDVELGEAPNHEKQVGRFKVVNQGTARQVQVRVSRIRHTYYLLGLAAVTLLAALAALFAPQRRLWLSEQDGVLVAITDEGRSGNEIRSLLATLEADRETV